MLYVVATPIGNLGDTTERARQCLRAAQYIVCEDTRHSKILLQSISVTSELISLHAHSSQSQYNRIVQLLQDGKDIALITDAGTPGISDPGSQLIARVHQLKIPVSPIPGPSSLTAALSVSGLPAEQFIFYGFLPKKKGRSTLLTALQTEKKTTVFFESPFRVKETIQEFHDILGPNRTICICRELTKKFESIWVGSLERAVKCKIVSKGEFVLVLEGKV